jgi:hypothetical protein
MASELPFSEFTHRKITQATDANTPLDESGLAAAGDRVMSIDITTDSDSASEYVFVYDAETVPSAAFQDSDDILFEMVVGASQNHHIDLNPSGTPPGYLLTKGLSVRVAASDDGSTATTANSAVDVSFKVKEAG